MKINILKKNYFGVWGYLKESQKYIFSVFGFFILFSLIGFLFPIFFVEEINKLITNLISTTDGLDFIHMVIFIFKNNAGISFIGLFFGAIFCIIPVFFTVLNGYVFGFVAQLSVHKAGFLSLFRVLPYGIFEIPAIMIGLALGIKLGFFIFSEKPVREFSRRLLLSLKIFIFIIIPLLIVAALIESYLILLLK